MKMTVLQRRHSDSRGANYSPLPPTFENLTAQLQEAFERAQYWKNRALTDHLTGLPNRGALLEHLSSALSEEAPEKGPSVGVAIGFIDLDKFKYTNDTFGHEAGDRVLKEVAAFLRSTLRDTDNLAIYEVTDEKMEMAGRLGGDEFVLVLRHTNTKGLQGRKKDIEGTLNMLSIDYQLPNGETVKIPIKGTLGLIDCNLNLTAEENLKIADREMYNHKFNKKAELESAESERRFKLAINHLMGNAP